MTDAQEPGTEPESSAISPVNADSTSPVARRKRRMIAIGAISAGVVALVIILIVAIGGSDDELSAQGDPSSTTAVAPSPTTTTAKAVAAPTTTEKVKPTTTTEAPETTIAETTTTVIETTTTVVETTTTVAATTTVPPTVPPSTAAPVTPVTAAAVGNCTPIGTLTIPKTNTVQTIIKETKQYADGLLCGNHRNDGIAEGVDVLPGMADFEATLQGGGALVGQIPAIIFGHRNSHNRPFKLIDTLVPGDGMTITNLDGSTIELVVSDLVLMSVGDATTTLLSPSADGAPGIKLVACAHGDGRPGGVSHRWIATVVRA